MELPEPEWWNDRIMLAGEEILSEYEMLEYRFNNCTVCNDTECPVNKIGSVKDQVISINECWIHGKFAARRIEERL